MNNTALLFSNEGRSGLPAVGVDNAARLDGITSRKLTECGQVGQLKEERKERKAKELPPTTTPAANRQQSAAEKVDRW